MSVYSTRLHLPFGYLQGFILLNPLVIQLDQSLPVVDLPSTIVVLFYWIPYCLVPMHGDSSLLLSFLVQPNIGWFLQSCIEHIQNLLGRFLLIYGYIGL